jgi:PAS domain S-box-containing protein
VNNFQVVGDDSCFHALVGAVTDCAIYMLDPNGIVISWNAGAERILGYPADQIVGRHFSCLFSDADQRIDRPHELLKIADRTGRFEDEPRQIRNNGSLFSALMVVDAIRDRDGKLIGFPTSPGT